MDRRRPMMWVSASLLLSCLELGGCGDDGEPGTADSTTTGGSTTDTPDTTGTPDTTSTSSSSGDVTTTGSADSGSTAVADTGSGTTSGSTTSGVGTGTTEGTQGTGTTGLADCHPLIVEVFYDAEGGDDELQWVKLYNPCNADVDVSQWTIGYGGEDYGAPRQKALFGSIGAGQCYVVGGPTSAATNGNPTYELAEDFAPGLDPAQAAGGGVALFDLPEDDVDATTVPVDAVVYGPNNDNNLIDETGQPVDEPHVANPTPDSGGSIRRTAESPTWEVTAVPTPDTCPPF